MTSLKSPKAGKYSIGSPSEVFVVSDHGKCSCLLKRTDVSIVGDDMNVCDVCRSFDSYVRLRVEYSWDHRGTLNFIICSFE